MRLRVLATLACGLTCIAGCSCKEEGPGGTSEAAPANTASAIMLLYDVSASTKPEQRDQYVDYGQQLWKQVSKDSSEVARPVALHGALVTGLGIADEIILFEVIVPEYNFLSMQGQDGIRAKTNEAGKKVASGLERLKTSKLQNTAILDGLDLAERFFRKHPKAAKKLYLFSDMLEQSERLNMGDANVKLDKEGIESFIELEREQGLVPNLAGVRVVVCGAEAPDSSTYRKVRAFWLAYLRAAGADVDLADYGTTLSLP